MPNTSALQNRKKMTGKKGEDIACTYLKRKGYEIIARNYRKTWGEIDIIAIKDHITHFFEVKSVTGVSSMNSNGHRPEENVHNLKLRNIRRMIVTYLEESKRGIDTPFQFHVVCVFMDMKTRRA